MAFIRVKSPGLLTTIQDSGRFKYQQSGVCVSGVMDSFAHKIANILVSNDDLNEAVLEITMIGPSLLFSSDAIISLTGGDLSPAVNGKPVNNWETLAINAGSTLSFGVMKTGTRAYMAIYGGFDVPIVMDSKSTYMRAQIGGFEGRALRSGDELAYFDRNVTDIPLYKIPEQYIPNYEDQIELRVILGPQDDYFTDQGINTLLSTPYKVSGEFDRMGYRLEGENIQHKDGGDIISDGMVMGAIQVPGGGQPIILMADRQTTGGYTKIATIISSDLYKIGQAKAGTILNFKKISVEEAQDVFIETENLFEEIKENLTIIPNIRNNSINIIPLGSPNTSLYKLNINGVDYDVAVEEI